MLTLLLTSRLAINKQMGILILYFCFVTKIFKSQFNTQDFPKGVVPIRTDTYFLFLRQTALVCKSCRFTLRKTPLELTWHHVAGNLLRYNFNLEVYIFEKFYHWNIMRWTSGFPEIMETSSAHCIWYKVWNVTTVTLRWISSTILPLLVYTVLFSLCEVYLILCAVV